jgi:hypothetical protein
MLRSPILYAKEITLILVTVLLCSGCKKFIHLEKPPNLINSEAVFTNDKTALSAISSVYIQMRNTTQIMTNGGLSIFTGLSSDEILPSTSNSLYDPFYMDSIPSNNATISSNFWTSAYVNIYKINSVLKGLTDPACTVTDALREQLLGEAKVVRALYYFYLANLFGDVPLVLTTDYTINAIMPRAPVAQIYNQIIIDLREAETILKPAYPTTGKVRPNKWTATALLSRVYLYQQNWTDAEQKASEVINSGTYVLSTINAAFLKNTSETIWEVAPINEAANTAEGSSFIPSSVTTRPTFIITPNLMSDFEPSDLRRKNWIDSSTVSSVKYYYPKKYKQRVVTTPINEYNIVLRLAELYLIRAEARTHLNNYVDARNDINLVRSRAALTNVIASTQPLLLAAIEHERRIEFFSEWGHRWLDLKRTERVNAVLGAIKSNWQNYASLYPIPLTQMTLNTSLVQNPGY